MPLIVRFLHAQMRRHPQRGLTVPQFRALVFVSHNQEASLSAMAEHLGLSLPAASRAVNLLVNRGLMERQVRCDDRRSVSLSLSSQGKAVLRRSSRAARRALACQFKALTARDLGTISRAMKALSRALGAAQGARS